MVELPLIHLPGGPYRLTITETVNGVWWTAAEPCPCVAGGHWHDVADSPSWLGLVQDLLVHHLEGATS
jgi:hypothetical protein